MNTVVIDDLDSSQAAAWWFLDTLVVEHRRAPQMSSIVLEMTLPVGHAPALHVHETLDDTWYILGGLMAVRCGDDEYVATAGNWVSMPRGGRDDVDPDVARHCLMSHQDRFVVRASFARPRG